MTDNLNVVERIFYGNSRPITYFVTGFIGSPIIGSLVIKAFSFIGASAEKSTEFIPPAVTMGFGTLACICLGWTYTALISVGIWRFYQKKSHWIRYVLISLMALHLILTSLLTFMFIDFSILSTQILQEGGRFLLNVR